MSNHFPSEEDFRRFAEATAQSPLSILMSGCLGGELCGFDGSNYGGPGFLAALFSLPNVRITRFCPENFAFGTPRALCDIHGGNGFDVLDGKARVLTESGEDWTSRALAAAERMLQIAHEADAGLAVLMDISASCGSQVIYDGNRRVPSPKYQRGPGVCAARLMRAGIPVISQRDFATLSRLFDALGASFPSAVPRHDHHETDWYRDYFKTR
ncbi:MAG: DUF523 domain-containing protein [Alphaproteobacteria bacterium]